MNWDEVIQRWNDRAAAMGYSGKKLLDLQAEFFTGAMTAAVALGVPHGEAMPPRVIISIMRGERIQ
jgi:hypothetical protein